ncbi:unnamed protein product [Miscanthus lutarioriparius]|uniref:Uncharacterized protein n=1 Tax=Miscanthus lutarioriparius TaxID=422564 RepID=A0A811Q9W4_9POAL|nr:unnamed protein product [Miscanthus lutarioriparius]
MAPPDRLPARQATRGTLLRAGHLLLAPRRRLPRPQRHHPEEPWIGAATLFLLYARAQSAPRRRAVSTASPRRTATRSSALLSPCSSDPARLPPRRSTAPPTRRLATETLAEHFVWPLPGTVPPRCRYTLAVTMRNQQKPRLDGNAFFTLESTMASIQGLHNFPRYGVDNAPDKFFTKAKERGREVHQINLAPVYVQAADSIAKLPEKTWSLFGMQD